MPLTTKSCLAQVYCRSAVRPTHNHFHHTPSVHYICIVTEKKQLPGDQLGYFTFLPNYKAALNTLQKKCVNKNYNITAFTPLLA